jgi:hypothetical protein
MGVAMCLPPQPECPLGPLDTLPRHPGGRDAMVKGPLQPLWRQGRLGRKAAAVGMPAPLQRVASLGHAGGSESARSRRRWPWGVAEVTPPLWPFSTRPAVPLYGRAPPPQAGLVAGLPSPRRPARPGEPPDARPQTGAKRRGGLRPPTAPVPPEAARLGRCIAMPFRHLPAMFALHGAAPAAERGPRAAPRGAAGKAWPYMSCHRGQPACLCPYRLQP